MEDHVGGSSSSSDEDSAPAVIMPPPSHQHNINEDEIIDLDAIDDHHRRRRRNNQHRRQLRNSGHPAIIDAIRGGPGVLIDLVGRSSSAISIDRAAEEDAAAAAAVASGICDPNRVRNYKDMFRYVNDLADGMPMNIHQDIEALSFTEEVSITTACAYLCC